MLLDLFDDVFLLHLALETAQSIFQRLTLLNADFSHLDFTILPMHVAMIAVNHLSPRGKPYQLGYWDSLLADPPTEVKLCFLISGPGILPLGRTLVWD